MKLILTHEVANLGEPGDVVTVKDGYGRNYLLPRGYAIGWTKGAEKQIETIRKARKAREVRDLQHAQELKTELEALHVRLTSPAGKSGQLYGSITPADIASAVTKAGSLQIDKRRIQIANPIKSTGSHKVTVRLHQDVVATIGLTVAAA